MGYRKGYIPPYLDRRVGDVVKIVDDEGDIGLGRINGPCNDGVYPVIAHGLPDKILFLPASQLKDPPQERKFYCRPCCFTSKERVEAEVLCPEGCKAYYCFKCDDKVHRRFPKSLHMRERLVPEKLVDKWKEPKRKISVEARLSQNGKKEARGATWYEFFWGQCEEEVYISVPVPPKTKSKQIFVQLFPSDDEKAWQQIIISIAGENDEMAELIDGELEYRVKLDKNQDLEATYADWELQDFEKKRNPDFEDPFEDPWPESKWAGYRVVVVTLHKVWARGDYDEENYGQRKLNPVWFKRIFRDTPAIDMSMVDMKMTRKEFWD